MTRSRGHQLLEVKGQAVGALREEIDDLSINGPAQDRLDEVLHRLAVEWSQVDPAHPFGAQELRQEWRRRVAAMEFVSSVGRQQEQRFIAKIPDQEAQEITGRGVGPVDVLQDEDDGSPLCRLTEDREHGVEQPDEADIGRSLDPATSRRRPSTGVPTRIREERRDRIRVIGDDGRVARISPAEPRPERLDERGVGKAVAVQVEARDPAGPAYRPRPSR